MSHKVLIIGLDGVTFDVIDPLMEEGLLPNLAGLIAKGTSGRMLSTVPPISGPSWISLATGLKPERTSIYDFTYRKDDSYELHHISSSDYSGRSVWDYLSRAGRTVGILNYPLCFPPYEVNGFLSAGLGTSEDNEFAFPGSLKQELDTAAGGKYEMTVGYHDIRYEDTELFLSDLQRILEKKLRVATYLVKEKEWDFFWFVLSETDWMQHLMWRHIDENHSQHEGQKSRDLYERFKQLWIRIDNAIGELADLAGEQSNLIVHSDHGFGPNEAVFKLNVWLEREGYLVWRGKKKKKAGSVRDELLNRCKAMAKALKLHKLAPGLYDYGRATKQKLIDKTIDHIDLEKSIAFDPGHTIPFGGIYINDRLVDTDQKKKEISREIEQKLRDYAKGNNLKVDVWRKSDLPESDSNTGPDLIVGIDDWRCVVLKDPLEGDVIERRPYSTRHSGSHRMDGIFVAAGPDIQSGRIENIQLFDIAPTVLHLLEIPIPSNMDGQVRTDVIAADYLAHRPVGIQGEIPQTSAEVVGQTRDMTQEEQDAIQQQLKDLGYM
ncbi:alkaline phosphatase family protein [Planctomycetota bacterium]